MGRPELDIGVMDEMLTWSEIEARYTGEFVAMVEIEAAPGPSIVRARVVWHGDDRDDGWARIDEFEPSYVGVLYIGPIYADEEPVLMM